MHKTDIAVHIAARSIRRGAIPSVALALLASPTMAQAPAPSTTTAEGAFRDVFGVNPDSLATIMASGGDSLMGAVAGTIVTIALFAAIIALVLTFMTGVAQSAYDGELLGKRYSSLWVPLRSVLGIGFLTPLPGGYCLLQSIVLWIAAQGSSFADQAWTAGLGVFSRESMARMSVPTKSQRDTVQAMFSAAVCAAKANQVGDSAGMLLGRPEVTTSLLPVQRIVTTDPVAIATMLAQPRPYFRLQGGVSFDGAAGLSGSRAVCGDVRVEQTMVVGSGPLASAIRGSFDAQVAHLHTLARSVEAVASRVVTDQVSSTQARQMLLAIESDFARAEASRLQTYAAQGAQVMGAAQRHALTETAEGGWASAGAYYMILARQSSSISDAANADLMVSGPRLDQMPQSLRTDLGPYLMAATAAGIDGSGTGRVDLESAMNGVSAQGVDDASNGLVSQIWRAQNNVDGMELSMTGIAHRMMWENTLAKVDVTGRYVFSMLRDTMVGEPGSDPIMNLQLVGHNGLTAIEVLIGALVAIIIVTGGSVVGLGASFTGMMTLVGALIAFGGPMVMLAYYLPMIPYIYWMFGMVGWTLLLIEAVVIAPMWAAAHVLPEGDGLAGQHARQGWMLMVSLLLRPVLMVAGFFAGILVTRFMSALVNSTFITMMDASMDGRVMGVVSVIAYLVAITAIMIAIAKAAFSLIYEVPNRALRYLGGSEALGDMGGLSSSHRAGAVIGGLIGGAVASANRGATTMAGAGSSANNSAKKPAK